MGWLALAMPCHYIQNQDTFQKRETQHKTHNPQWAQPKGELVSSKTHAAPRDALLDTFSGHFHNPLQTPRLHCLKFSGHFPQNGHLQKSPHGMIFTPMDTTEAPQTAPAKPKRRKLTMQDAQAVADLVIGSKCTEKEACLNLDINPDQWKCWKSKHQRDATFDTLCARLRGSEIQHSMRQIKNCGDVVGMKPDWRAHAFRLGAIAPERFGAQAGTQAPGQAVNSLTDDSMARLLSMLRSSQAPAAVVDCPSSVSTIKTITDVEAKA